MNTKKTSLSGPAGERVRPRACGWLGVALMVCLASSTQGCGQAEEAASDVDHPSEEGEVLAQAVASDASVRVDAGAAPGDAGASAVARPSSLTFRTSTAPFGGRYKPKNIGAIWVETSTGTFVKTLKRWARIRARYLTRFAAASRNNLVDAVSGATLANHNVRHEVKWNLTDVARKRVPDGQYRIAIELTDRDGPGALLYVPFTLGATGARIVPTPTAQFLNMELLLQ